MGDVVRCETLRSDWRLRRLSSPWVRLCGVGVIVLLCVGCQRLDPLWIRATEHLKPEWTSEISDDAQD